MEMLNSAAFLVALVCSVDLVCWGWAWACLIQLPSKGLSCLLQAQGCDISWQEHEERGVFSVPVPTQLAVTWGTPIAPAACAKGDGCVPLVR